MKDNRSTTRKEVSCASSARAAKENGPSKEKVKGREVSKVNVLSAAKPATEQQTAGKGRRAKAKEREIKKEVRTIIKDHGMEEKDKRKERAASTPSAATRSRHNRSQWHISSRAQTSGSPRTS